ncbi:MAG: GNAT family N-acetyltransferase [Desulfobulbia bacterium]
MIIRRASQSDLPELQELARRTIDRNYRSFLGDESVDWFLESGESDKEVIENLDNCSVAEEGDKQIAYCVYYEDFIHILMVDPDFQRAGIGKQMLGYVEDEFRRSGRSKCRLESFQENSQAINFYLGNGFVTMAEEVDPNSGVSRVHMSKQL